MTQSTIFFLDFFWSVRNFLHIAFSMRNYFKSGTLLIAEPFITDDSFFRAVVLIIEDNAEGTMGVVINDSSNLLMKAASEVDGAEITLKLYFGGPVESKQTMNFLHHCSDIPNALNVGEGIYWGGNAFDIIDKHQTGELNETNAIAIAGYCGWGPDQLQKELDEKTWIVSKFKSSYIFMNANYVWKKALSDLGGEYSWLAQAPTDVKLN